MPAKYERLPTEPQYISSRESSPSPSYAVYPPSHGTFDSFANSNQDVEQEGSRRPRVRRKPLPSFDSDPRFRQPTPSPYARAGLLLFTVFLFWLAFDMRKSIWVGSVMGMRKSVIEEVDPSY